MNDLNIETVPGRPIRPGDDVVVSQEKLLAWRDEAVAKAREEADILARIGQMQHLLAHFYGYEPLVHYCAGLIANLKDRLAHLANQQPNHKEVKL